MFCRGSMRKVMRIRIMRVRCLEKNQDRFLGCYMRNFVGQSFMFLKERQNIWQSCMNCWSRYTTSSKKNRIRRLSGIRSTGMPVITVMYSLRIVSENRSCRKNPSQQIWSWTVILQISDICISLESTSVKMNGRRQSIWTVFQKRRSGRWQMSIQKDTASDSWIREKTFRRNQW